MKSDISRSTFDPGKHYSSVRMQQGRVQVDADWNEQADIVAHRIETETADVIGQTGAPINGGGFEISMVNDGKNLAVSLGRIYVDGILCENDNQINYTEQEDFPDQKLPGAEGKYLVYLDVWKRNITWLDDTSIREVALGGPDTATRVKTVWQVKFSEKLSGQCCEDALKSITDAVISQGALCAVVASNDSKPNDCLVPPSAGYTGLENQLYRVEIHAGGNIGTATFKWSRDNGSIVFGVDEILSDADGRLTKIKLKQWWRDGYQSLKQGDWVEVIDDVMELTQTPGIMAQVAETPDEDKHIVTLSKEILGIDVSKHAKIRRWDQTDRVDPNTKQLIDISNGIQIISTDDIEIENGIYVKFSGDNFKAGDYWLIPARTATADEQSGNIEWPFTEPQSPSGIIHHYAALAIITLSANDGTVLIDGQPEDCRELFPAITGLTSLLYVGGDGQEAMPGELLPCPLQVRVANGEFPVIDAKVQFEVTSGGGSIDPQSPAETLDPDGLATCNWTLGKSGIQQVTAKLLNAADVEMDGQIVCFNAALSVAENVSYSPMDCAADPTVLSFLEAARKWPPASDGAGNITVKQTLDAILCGLDASSIPVGSGLCQELDKAATVQEALRVLCNLPRGGCCCERVKPGGILDEAIYGALEYRLKKGERNPSICICLNPGEYRIEGLSELSDFVKKLMGEGRRISISIKGCGFDTRIEIMKPIKLSGLSSFTLSNVSIGTGDRIDLSNAPGAIVLEHCSRIEIESCNLFGIMDKGALLVIAGTDKLGMSNNHFEVGTRDSFTNPQRFIVPLFKKVKGLSDSIDKLFGETNQLLFEESSYNVSKILSDLKEDELDTIKKEAEKMPSAISKEQASSPLSQGELFSYAKFVGVLSLNVNPDIIAAALHDIRKAALKAMPGTALILQPWSEVVKTEDYLMDIADMDEDDALRLENNDIVGVVSLYGEPDLSESFSFDAAEMRDLVTKKNISILGGIGTVFISGNHLTRLVVSTQTVRFINTSFGNKKGTTRAFRCLLGNNIIEGDSNQLVANHLTVSFNAFTMSASRKPKMEDTKGIPSAIALTSIADSSFFIGNRGDVDILDVSRLSNRLSNQSANLINNFW